MPEQPTVISSDEMRDALCRAGMLPENVRMTSGTYMLLSERDVSEKLSVAFTNILIETGYGYKPGVRACKQFARWAAAWAELWHAEQASEHALAFGTLIIPSRGHEANFAIHQSDAEVIYAAAYEPQRNEYGFSLSLMTLTPGEWRQSECDC